MNLKYTLYTATNDDNNDEDELFKVLLIDNMSSEHFKGIMTETEHI